MYFFSDKMSSLYVQCLKSRVEKAWKEEMANNHTKVDSLHTEKRDHVPVHHHYRKRACHHADHVQVNGSDTKSMSSVLYSFDDFTLVYYQVHLSYRIKPVESRCFEKPSRIVFWYMCEV